MVIGRDVPPSRSRVDAKRKSDQAHRNENRPTVTAELRAIGRTIEMKVRQYDAPSIWAAWRMSSGMLDMKAVKSMTAKGTARVESARTRPGRVSRRPRSL